VARSALQAVRVARQQGRKVGLFRPVSLWPFPEEALHALSEKVRKILVAEMSSGQMLEDVRLAAAPSCKIDFLGAMGGELIYPGTILSRLQEE
jgi:2-oxoglutarate ferredoxin oxidoreductase subunit alpha